MRRFRLTAFAAIYPKAFDRGLFCAAFALLIYRDREKDDAEILDIFIASLFHDIGLLDIDPRVVSSAQRHTAEDDTIYFQHALLGANFISSTCDTSNTVAEAIAQHHEHVDGTGFPNGMQGLGLSEMAQVIHLLNNLQIVYLKHFKPRQRKLANTIPIIEMNSVSRFGAIAKSVIQLLNKGKPALVSQLSHTMVGPIIAAVRERYVYIGHAHHAIEQFTRTVGFRHDNRELFTLQNGFIHIAITLSKSANVNEAYLRWLDQVEQFELKHAYQEIEDTYLMMNEVIYHIEKFKQKLSFYHGVCKNSKVKQCAEETLAALSNCKSPSLTLTLAQSAREM
jgi:HD domain